MNKRREKRRKKRMVCATIIGGRRYSGLVLDISPRGMFIQTNARPDPGDALEVELSLPGKKETVVVQARVARKRVVPPQLLTVAGGGLGLMIDSAPEGYYEFLSGIATDWKADARGEEQPMPSAGKAVGKTKGAGKGKAKRQRFRVRVEKTDQSDTKQFLLACASEDQARSQVQSELGDEWKILSIEAL